MSLTGRLVGQSHWTVDDLIAWEGEDMRREIRWVTIPTNVERQLRLDLANPACWTGDDGPYCREYVVGILTQYERITKVSDSQLRGLINIMHTADVLRRAAILAAAIPDASTHWPRPQMIVGTAALAEPIPEKLWVPVKDLQHLPVSAGWIYDRIRSQEIPSRKEGRSLLVPLQQVTALVTQLKEAGQIHRKVRRPKVATPPHRPWYKRLFGA